MTTPVILILLFITKQWLCDNILQTPFRWIWANKGKYLHPGGLTHAAIHAVLTFLILAYFLNGKTALIVAAIEFVVHYHQDWLKWYVKHKFNITGEDRMNYILGGLDSYLHYLFYVVVICVVT